MPFRRNRRVGKGVECPENARNVEQAVDFRHRAAQVPARQPQGADRPDPMEPITDLSLSANAVSDDRHVGAENFAGEKAVAAPVREIPVGGSSLPSASPVPGLADATFG